MDRPYSSFYARTSSPWSSENFAEARPSNGLGSGRRAHKSTSEQDNQSAYQFDEGSRETSYDHGSPTAHIAFDAAKELTTWNGHEQHSPSRMCLEQPLLYTVPRHSDLMDMPGWAPTASSFAQSFSNNMAFQPIQNNIWTSTVTNHGTPLLNFDTHASDLRYLYDPSADDVIYIGQRSRKRPTLLEESENNDTATRIGSVLSNGKFACADEHCAGQTFARLAELRRHHNTIHATDKPDFWCPVPACPRSAIGGGEAFHRKDKLTTHVKSMHS